MEILNFLPFLFVGISLGLLGGGGSILAVPIFVYILGLDVVSSTAYSLFVVGLSSSIGAFQNYKSKNIDFKVALIFGLPSLLSVWISRKYLLVAIPDILFQIGDFVVTKRMFILILFSVLMIATAISMIFVKVKENKEGKPISKVFMAIQGLFDGIITGLVGAGGGFMIIPALVILSKIPVRIAIGCSLLIIFVKSMIGFLGSVSSISPDYFLLAKVTLLSGLGIFIGTSLSKKIDSSKLKVAFGYFVLVVAFYIIAKEIYKF